MRKMLSVLAVMCMLTVGVVAESPHVEAEPAEDPLHEISIDKSVGALAQAAAQGSLEDMVEAAYTILGNEIGPVEGSLCIRGVPSKSIFDLGLVNINFNLRGALEVPAGLSAQVHGEGDLMVRILEIEAGLGNCSATGIAYVAYTGFEIIEGGSWPEWLAQ